MMYWSIQTLILLTLVALCDSMKDVIVVGAGLSGAAAARTLHNTKQFRVTILEARPNRLGGRIWTDRANKHAQGPECELGHLWIHEPVPGSEFSQLLNRLELTLKDLGDVELSTADGRARETWKTLHTMIQDAIISGIREEISYRTDKTDFSLASILKSLDPFILGNLTIPWKTLAHALISPQFGTKLAPLSAVDFQSGRLVGGVQVLEGLDELVNRLIGGTHSELPIDVDLGKVVRQIKIDYPTSKVKVRTVERRSFTADAVVLAVPIGVLKEGSIHFEPKLSRAKKTAIKNMGVGLVNTVIVEFSRTFWPPDVSVFVSAVDGVTFPVWVDSYGTTSKPVLTSYTYGEAAKKLERMSDEEVQTLAIESLKTIFSSTRISQASVVSLTHSAWQKDSYAVGSSSYLPVGISLSDRREISRPISPYLYFAGEHTSLDKGGTLEGAYLSGVEAAEALIRDTHKRDTHKDDSRTLGTDAGDEQQTHREL